MADKFISANALTCDLIGKEFYPVIVRRAIENVPAVDVVEVVRCKDCEKKREEHGYLWCYCFEKQVKINDFCSYGEKKE